MKNYPIILDNKATNFDLTNLPWKTIIPAILVVCSLFSLSIAFGIYFAKIVYSITDYINNGNISKIIQFRKKFTVKNIIEFILDHLVIFFITWICKIGQKCDLIGEAIWATFQGLIFFLLLFIKRLIKFKYNFKKFPWSTLFEDFKILLSLFRDLYLTVMSLFQEICFLSNLKNFIDSWWTIIVFLLTNSTLIAEFISLFYLILLCFFGFFLGFLYGIYRREDELYIFFLLLLLQLLYQIEDLDPLPEIKRETLSKFSLQIIEEVKTNPSKLLLKESNQKTEIPFPILPEIPFPILVDPYISIKVEPDQSKSYKFELVKFYRRVKDKIV